MQSELLPPAVLEAQVELVGAVLPSRKLASGHVQWERRTELVQVVQVEASL